MEQQVFDDGLGQFLHHMESLSDDTYVSLDDLFLVLSFPLPEEVNKYLSKEIDYATLCRTVAPCRLICQRCGESTESRWLSRSRMAERQSPHPTLSGMGRAWKEGTQFPSS